jgi:divalent metal cation (Fe/Co/Zn/Cd) transporter
LAYNVLEAIAALWVGHQSHSISLWGFGLDSVIEVSATGVVLWHLLRKPLGHTQPCSHSEHGDGHPHAHEHQTHAHPHSHNENPDTPRWIHQFIALTFWLLAVYIVTEAMLGLMAHNTPIISWPGLLIGGLSVAIMPLLAWRKMHLAKQIGQQTGQQLGNPQDESIITAEAKETLACGMLSLTMLVGLLLNYAFGWWWADGVTALCMTFWLIKEGQHCWQEGLCVH